VMTTITPGPTNVRRGLAYRASAGFVAATDAMSVASPEKLSSEKLMPSWAVSSYEPLQLLDPVLHDALARWPRERAATSTGYQEQVRSRPWRPVLQECDGGGGLVHNRV